MKTIAMLAAIIASSALAEEESPALIEFRADMERIFDFCEVQWPGDYVMIAHCKEQQVEARMIYNDRMIEIREADDLTRREVLIDILARCRVQWSVSDDSADWVMVDGRRRANAMQIAERLGSRMIRLRY